MMMLWIEEPSTSYRLQLDGLVVFVRIVCKKMTAYLLPTTGKQLPVLLLIFSFTKMMTTTRHLRNCCRRREWTSHQRRRLRYLSRTYYNFRSKYGKWSHLQIGTGSSWSVPTHVSLFSTTPSSSKDRDIFKSNDTTIFPSDTDNATNSTTSDPPVVTWWFRYFPTNAHPYIRLARLDKPIGTWLLLWPCYWSTALAASPGAWPDLSLMTLFGVGAVVMRGAGCTINDMWDQPFDRHVARTQNRPLASGELTHTQAWGFLALQLSTGCAVLLSLPHTWYCFQWGVASLPLVATYPLLKRVTNWPQLGLGLVFNWGAWMGWAATYGTMNWSVIAPLYLSGITWTLCYDTLYAHQDKEDDAKLGLKSTALYFGQYTKPVLHLFALTTYLNWYLVGCSEAFFPTAPIIDAASTPAIVIANADSLLVGSTELLSPELLLHYASMPDIWYLVGTTAAYSHLVWQIQTADLDQPTNLATRFRSNAMVGALMFTSIVAAKLHVGI
jgi:4-hydroxybenzoate polyprenyltransferase